MRAWQHYQPTRITFAAGAVDALDDQPMGRRLGLITTAGFRRRGEVDRLAERLGERLVVVIDDVLANPDVEAIDAQAQRLRAVGVDGLIALGGGSSIDTAKALARLLGQPEGVTLAGHFRDGQALAVLPALPVTALPTTAGTGAEVTPFATVWDFARGQKYSLTGEDLYPVAAVLDPQLTYALPREVTISSGLDALSHALESAWNRNATPVSLALAGQSLALSMAALPRLEADLSDEQARGQIFEASLLGGLAISHTRTALAHSISYPLTVHFGLAHGLACSFTLPALARYNAEADDGRLYRVARSAGYAHLCELIEALSGLLERLELAERVRGHIPQGSAACALVEQMVTPGRADNNLRPADLAQIQSLVRESLSF